MSDRFYITGQQPEQNDLLRNLQRVLAVQLDDSGDVVMLSPALRTLKESLPYARITLMTSSAGSQVAPLLPWIDDVLVFPTARRSYTGSLFSPREEAAFIKRLRSQQFSAALIFTSVAQSAAQAAYICYLAGIPYRVGFASKNKGSGLSHVLTPPAESMHQVDRNLYLLEALGAGAANTQVELKIPRSIDHRASEMLSETGLKEGIPYIVLAPGACVISQYDPAHFATVAHILAAQTELQLVIVGDPEEADNIQPILRVAQENLYGNIHSLVAKTSLPELAAVIRRASLTIASNSISMHFADVFSCPMVLLSSRSEAVSQWLPPNTSLRLLSRPEACLSCRQVNCIHGINCQDVRPEEVAIAALELLFGQNQTTGRELLGYPINTQTQEQLYPLTENFS